MYLLLTNRLPPSAVKRSVQDELIPPRQLNPTLSLSVERAFAKSLSSTSRPALSYDAGFRASLTPTSLRCTCGHDACWTARSHIHHSIHTANMLHQSNLHQFMPTLAYHSLLGNLNQLRHIQLYLPPHRHLLAMLWYLNRPLSPRILCLHHLVRAACLDSSNPCFLSCLFYS